MLFPITHDSVMLTSNIVSLKFGGNLRPLIVQWCLHLKSARTVMTYCEPCLSHAKPPNGSYLSREASKAEL